MPEPISLFYAARDPGLSNMKDASAPELQKLMESLDKKLDTLVVLARTTKFGPESEFHFLFRDRLVKMCLPFADVDVIQRHIALHYGFYEQKALLQVAHYIGPNTVVLEAGANIGNHTIFFAKICGAKEVMAFEVMHETFKLLERNIAINDLTNVRLFNLGLGARKGRADLGHFGQGNIGGASIQAATGDGNYEIAAVDSLGLEALHFMKIDVEGSHLDVLQGARETIARYKPRIWIELRANRGEREAGEQLLKQLGYRATLELSRNDLLFEPV